jgi:ribosome-binding factor A
LTLRQMKQFIPELRFRDDTSFDNYSRRSTRCLRSPEVARDLDHDDDADETGDESAGSEGEGNA